MKRKSKKDELSSAVIEEDDVSDHENEEAEEFSEDEDQGEQIDFTDEEEDEDYDSKPKKKKAKRNRFIDMEAEVGDEDEEDEDEDDYEGLGSEDELDDDELPTAEEYLRRAPLIPRVIHEEDEVLDAEAEEARLRRLYGQSSRTIDESSSGGIPKSAMLMPRATDPKLWLVKCKIGRERDAVVGLLRGLLGVRVKEEAGLDVGVKASPQVFSAVCRDTLKGYIYVEAYKPADIIQAVQSLHLNHMIYASHLSKPALVPMTEMADVLSVTASKTAATGAASSYEAVMPGDWVRVKRGKYNGDLAQIVEAPESLDSRSLVKIKLLPRLSYRAVSTNSGSKDRVPARPFDPQEASQYGPVTKSRGFWIFSGESYKDGFLVKEVKLISLSPGAVPRPDELERFGVSADAVEMSPRRQKQAKTAPTFSKDEQVVVIEGDMKGIVGRILDVNTSGTGPAWINLIVDHADIKGPISVRADHLRKHFDVGQKVRHIQTGETGMVVNVDETGKALFFSYLKQSQTLISPDLLQDASAAPNQAVMPVGSSTASNAAGDFDLDDLVQTEDAEGVFGIVVRVMTEEAAVSVIDQSGTTRTISMGNLKKIQTPPAAKTELFKAGDRVQVDSAEGIASRPATILQVHRNIAFCRALDTKEVLVRRFPAIHAMTAYAPSHHAESSHRKAMGSGGAGGGMHLLGKSVAIVGGPHKGYIGIVKSIVDDTVRVELHTNSKMVSVNRDRVIVQDGSGGQRSGEHESSSRYSSSDDRGKTPAWSSSKTPGWSSSKTPAWSSSKTPAWGASSSSRTPAHGDAGGKTPAWNSSAKTPAWNSAAKTPAWNSAAKTPAWGAQAKTPLWSSSNVRTPAHTSAPSAAATWSAPTPAWNSAAGNQSSSVAPVWAVQGAMVKVRGSSGEALPIASASGGQVSLPTGTFNLSDLEPVQPAKRDRVKLVGAEESSSLGTVIGLDGGDAVVRLDGSSNFRIVKLSNLVKLQQ